MNALDPTARRVGPKPWSALAAATIVLTLVDPGCADTGDDRRFRCDSIVLTRDPANGTCVEVPVCPRDQAEPTSVQSCASLTELTCRSTVACCADYASDHTFLGCINAAH